MALRFRRLGVIYRVLPQIYSGNHYRQSRQDINLFPSHLNPLSQVWANIYRSFEERRGHFQRFSTVPETSQESLPEIDLLSFIESTVNEFEGPCHRWLNKTEDSKVFYKRDGVFLVLAGAFLGDSLVSGCDPIIMLEKVKLLQQRYPMLHVMGFQFSSSIFSDAVCTRLLQMIMKEYITFPILLSNKNFSEMTDGACFILFKGFRNPLLYHETDVNIEIIDKVIKELNVQGNENPSLMSNLKSTWVKQTEVIKEPYVSSSLRNMLLYFPGCISVDESGNRFFLSDSCHHRIVIFDCNGKLMDCIGSSPGFEDGAFEFAKLLHPAASFYHAVEDCLYFVDSENHAIRRADMQRRVLETLYPTCNASKKNSTIWSWIIDKLWMKREVDTMSEEFSTESFLFPWHLMKSLDNNLFILNRSFETLWIMDLASGVIKEVVKGLPKIVEICGQMILEKTSLLKQMPCDWLQNQVENSCQLEKIPYAGLMSSLATFQNHIIICDTVGQRVLKFNRESGSISSFRFSNFGILGLPYWVSSSLERVFAGGNGLSGVPTDHVQCFNLLPGRIDIQLNVDIPEDIELVEPLQEGCVWRQARGVATEISRGESSGASLEKVSIAQQWYDELDNLVFLTPEEELSAEEENISDENLQEGRVCIACAINTSPGTSEVIIYAALYVKLKRNPNSAEDSQVKKAARIDDILNPQKSGRMGLRDPFIQLMSISNQDLGELVFVKPLHVRLKFDCRDHPKAVNSKDIILTNTSIEVNVALN